MKKDSKVVASPLAKKLAKEHSVDIQEISYDGKRMTSEDVESFIAAKDGAKGTARFVVKDSSRSSYSPSNVLKFALPAEQEVREMSPMQKVIGKRLLESKQNIPHFYVETVCNVDSMIQMRSNINSKLSEQNLKVSMNDMFVCAISRALARNPAVNSISQKDKIIRMPSVDIAVAVAVDDGLITPIVFGAHSMSLIDISIKLKSLIKKARAKKLTPEEFQGGTFSVSNLGMFQVNSFLPIINPPHAGIISLGKGILQPVWNKETHSFVPGTEVRISLAADHRIVNGDQAARFMGHIKELVECPDLMML